MLLLMMGCGLSESLKKKQAVSGGESAVNGPGRITEVVQMMCGGSLKSY